MDFETGQVVFSKCGRDKGLALIVLAVDGKWLTLANGKARKLAKPKRKQAKHVRPTNVIPAGIKEKIEAKSLKDANLRGALKRARKDLEG